MARAEKKGARIGDKALISAFYAWAHKVPYLRCYWCKKRLGLKGRTIDHIIPLSRGGAHDVFNLCASCEPCNGGKGSLMPEDVNGQYQAAFCASRKKAL